ncbi:SpoIIE family protein phosphatase [Nonomuraea phyllanthi]|uniref:protein-serine/threonine phosphatase n=1 Tax=Nonomuraea phyllanthi TaxID=2219224 RepID=A0A5C4VD29_9ACTN|nr:SpoIIE family protein phosphatase [Nonomuraea phyllanthi]KAB8188479.1 SpoIIE family protein phosphatase [Nonomuraea phyllanthi]QFY09781.1 SpoIIE family protein phosphatase [Nonomuraea phyllanthi]
MEDVHDVDIGGPAFEVFDATPVAVAVTRGPGHRLVYTNAVHRALVGEFPIGTPFRQALAGLAGDDCFAALDEVYRTGAPKERTGPQVLAASARRTDDERYLTACLSRVAFDDGEYGVLAVVQDATDEVVTARRLRQVADERRRVLRRYHSLMRISAEVIWVADPQGRVIEPAPAWERVTGQSWAESRGYGWLDALHPDDVPATVDSWRRAVSDQVECWECVYRVLTADGSYRHYEIRSVPVREDGRVVEWVGTASDIEDLWQRRRHTRLLDAAAAATSDVTSVDEMLNALANVVVPELADGCGFYWVIDLSEDLSRGGDFLLERVATAGRSGLPRWPPFSGERHAPNGRMARAIRLRRPFRKTFPRGKPPEDLLPTGTRKWVEATGGNGVAVVPVVIDGTVAAVLTATTTGDRPPMSQSDLTLLREMIDQMHDRLNSAMRFQRTHRIALALQYSLLAEPPHVPGLQIIARYRASPAAAEVGGDWYDSFVLSDGATVVAIGDVAGHDLRAAVAMGQLRNMLRALAVDRQEPPGLILGRLNTAMATLYAEQTATCVLARIEECGGGHELNYAVAGHPPPLLLGADGQARFLEGGANPLLGIPYDTPCASTRQALPPGSTLLLYTDGLVERPGEHLDKGFDRLRERASAQCRAPLDTLCDDLLSFLPHRTDDDVALIAVRCSGPSASRQAPAGG